jgi:hypothetical protein
MMTIVMIMTVMFTTMRMTARKIKKDDDDVDDNYL